MAEKSKKELFKLESKEEILRMKAIYRFIHDKGMTPEEVIDKYLDEKEKKELKEVDGQITMEIMKPLMDRHLKKKKEGGKE